MRMQDRIRNEDRPENRQHGVISAGPDEARSQWGQRPLFSVPGKDQPPPVEQGLGPEATRDPPVPEDRAVGSRLREDLERSEIPQVVLTRSFDNVSGVPTEDQIEAAFGPRPVGWVGVIIDAGGAGRVILCVRSTLSLWWYEIFTKAT